MKTVFWDFDGVILDSMKVRDWGFREIFKKYPESEVELLIQYHRKNGGLSRYVKIKYFYDKILNKPITNDQIQEYANNFSILMKEKLIDPSNLIQDSLDFIKVEHNNYQFHIVSGSDQEELRYLCKELKINSFFISIHGSPTPKKQLVRNLLKEYSYQTEETCLIGDSINDYEAAIENKISFFGYNNRLLKDYGPYISNFKHFKSRF